MSAFPQPYLRAVLTQASDCTSVVAVTDSSANEVVGLASAAVTRDGQRELGLLVEDRYQALGVGTLMLDTLIGLFDPQQPLCAFVSRENRWLLSKLLRFGSVAVEHDCGVSYARVRRR